MRFVSHRVLFLAACAASLLPFTAHATSDNAAMAGAEVSAAITHDHLPSLRGLMPKPDDFSGSKHVKEWKKIPLIDAPGFVQDAVAQTAPVTGGASTIAGLGFDGVGNGFTGPQGTYTVDSAPPDTNGAVGATQYVQWVNEAFAVFDKTTGKVVYGPVAGNTLWTGFGGPCETHNDGDPIVKYDRIANRWVMTQFALPSGGPYYQCVAVSQTSDATGAWNRYAFQYTNFPDYPKAGVWPDAYYVTFNMFKGNSFAGARLCAYDRNSMLNGAPATQQCFQLSTSYGGVLPADLDGATLPSAGSPNYMLSKGSSSLNFWKMHVDWANPANSTLSAAASVPVAAFNAACGGGSCVPQAGTSEQLDSLADRLMYRLAYRNFGTYESLVVNHSVAVGASRKNTYAAVRWYELRNLSANTPTVYQQSTFAPDSTFRWMGSIAMDKMGNIALGYSTSSSSLHPGIRFATRLKTDQLNTLSNETVMLQGTGSQLNNLNRWGDYSAMALDPVDDCTFWYTNEYLQANGTFNWSTRIASFKIAGCQ
ncbi:hypothetical protein GCM10027321_01910 [Massilia terrae]|uniref:Uncharacterized protein n=1 Tax=Massilia terrae TaxID=1811224 RepID=A0ABT2CTZ6_9BURK|nr:hypothetical protein [Massilia terrae]MCS0657447.1 hypothetical protein [Massilia terrae]